MIRELTVDGRSYRVRVQEAHGRFSVVIDDGALEVDYLPLRDGLASVLVGGRSHDIALEPYPRGCKVTLRSGQYDVTLADAMPTGMAHHAGSGLFRLLSPMPGKVVRILAREGQTVSAAQGLVVVEAMKMENELHAPRGGKVREVHVQEGQAVEAGALLVVVE